MLYSAATSLMIIAAYALVKKQALEPFAHAKISLPKIVINALGIFLLFSSYKYLAASSVAVVQRMDIPIVILISVFMRHAKSSLQFWLSVWAILLFAFFVADADVIDEDVQGFWLAFCGMLFLVMGYFLIKKATATDTISPLVWSYNISVLVGGILGLLVLQKSI
jgi:drug/metabolite transporter (DMT)-like permease